MYKLVNPINIRAQDMWDCIGPHVLWSGSRVIDYGVGFGDILAAARASGAVCFAMDKQLKDFQAGCDRRSEQISDYVVGIMNFDEYAPRVGYDVAFCCSVLPYLTDPDLMLAVMADYSKMSFIECQYYGDGPGKVVDDHAMKAWLEKYWTHVLKIGSTFVDGRDKHRAIWKCFNE